MKITQTIVAAVLGAAVVDAFVPMNQSSLNILKNEPSSTSLYGAFNRRNKQADLMKKMQEAKKQRELNEGGEVAAAIVEEEKSKANKRLSDEEMKTQNDLKRFQELLDSESATVNYDIGGSNYKTKQQEEEEIDAGARGADRMFEGDPAPTDVFEDLVNFTTGNALGKNGASRVVPWLNKSSAKQKDCLVVLTDPREKSSELRSSLKSISKLLPADIRSKMIIINADTPAENRRFLKKNEIDNLNIYCDEKREWMREYTVLGDKRWAMNLLVLQEGRVERLVREVDVELVTQVIKSSVTSLKK
ncbi:hypothetical protein CTEN210_03044 [Chaetoceros tenuissimus]|uniref:Thioredoxin domain-containing protein n=1 Tax=Chaetoceros tenuissimus TaxID=426638 RepID=A0AAD3CK30_9STRA|nr:hypothetical protein CTEN210_03044 [Chaetoceros tenuissimus]